MISIWNKNCELLKNRFPELFQQLLPIIKNVSVSFEIPCKLDCGWDIFFAKNGEISACYQNIALHSKYNPSNESEKLALALTDKIETIETLVFFGFGLGYNVVSLAKKNPSKNFVLIEPDSQKFITALHYIDFSAILNIANIVLLIGASHQTVLSILEMYKIKNCYFVRNKNHEMHEQKYFEDFDKLLKRNIAKDDINAKTLEKFASLWQKNSCKNLHQLVYLDGIARYKNIAKNLCACVLAAGPSLDSVLPYLKQIKERCILICVDTALRSCLRVGVEPDFIVLVDPQYWNARHILDLKSPSSVLITEIAAYPTVMRFECREKVLCSSLYPIGKYFEKSFPEKGLLGAGGSVATTAWDFARYCGCSQIFLAGLDLGFPNKKTHVSGSTFEERTHTQSMRLNTAETASVNVLYSATSIIKEDYNGNALLSDNRMSLYGWWFESKIAANENQKTYIFTSQGLKIPGINFFPIENFLKRDVVLNEKNEFFEIEKKRKDVFSESIQENICKFEMLKKDFIFKLKKMKENVLHGQKLCEQILCLLDMPEKQPANFEKAFQNVLSNLNQIDKKIISSEIEEITSLVFPSEKKLEEIFKKEKIPTEKKAASLFQSKIVYTQIIFAIDGYLRLFSE